MASSPEVALSSADNVTAVSPPASNSSSTSPSPPSPSPESSLPPPQISPPLSPPSTPPPPLADLSPPPPNSPPPSTVPTQSPPPNNLASPLGSPPPPVFSPPAPDVGDSPVPPSPTLSHSPPRSQSTNSGSSGPSSGLSAQSSSSDYTSIAIAGIIGGVVVILFLIFVCLTCRRRRNKQLYDMEHGLPTKGGGQYHKGPKQKNDSKPVDTNGKLPLPFGVMGTPLGGWVLSPSPAMGNASSEFCSSYSGQHPGHVRTPSPNMGGFGAKSQFCYEELEAATFRFSQANLLGQGGFGFVHKGVLPNGKEVAVKSLKSGSGQGEREFQAEVEIISRVHHRHLVSLVGYSIAGQQRMLVYEFVPNKTLEFHLHGMSNFLTEHLHILTEVNKYVVVGKDQPVMDWAARRRIAVGSAKGLAYLHEDCHPRIIHRDIKAANILLDFNFEAMVADFGLAKLTSDNYTHVSTRVMGTFGYLAPEYAASGKLTEKSDVFSFGVMLLELITGRQPIDLTDQFMEDSLVDWARPIMSKALETGDYSELVDPRLEDKYVPHEMSRMIACAAASIRHSARRRPRMSQIVRALDGDSSLDDLNEGVKSGESAACNSYDTCAYNADIMKFRKMVMSDQDLSSGATSEYGLNQSSESSSNSREMDVTSSQKQKQ